MSLLDRILDFLRGTSSAPPPPTLRNKPGGMAFINRAADENDGGIVLVNRIVCTTALDAQGKLVIDPPQAFRVTRWLRSGALGVGPGDLVLVTALPDFVLTPIRDAGDAERSEELAYLPPVPSSETVRGKAQGVRA